jgi:V8-like Glu-specific endopeptidase
MIPREAMTEGRNETYEIELSPLSKKNVCPEQKFTDQGTAAICSGFLVAPDVLVTAGHCVTSESSCRDYYWVFDYALTSAGDNQYSTASKENVYRCKKIYAQELDNTTMMDFGIVLLDRPVEGRNPLKISKEIRISDRTPIVVIGHPTGLPTKIAGGARVRDNSNQFFFSANLDTFGGNSGSAVFNEKTGDVVGILVRGESDYVNDDSRECQVVNKCPDSGCRGEDVTRIENIRQLKTILRERGV